MEIDFPFGKKYSWVAKYILVAKKLLKFNIQYIR